MSIAGYRGWLIATLRRLETTGLLLGGVYIDDGDGSATVVMNDDVTQSLAIIEVVISEIEMRLGHYDYYKAKTKFGVQPEASSSVFLARL